MNQDLSLTAPETEVIRGCANCQNPEVIEGHPTLLCYNCRTAFIKYPVPLWVKLFGCAVLLLFIVSLFYLPSNLSAGIWLAKAKKAEQQKQYLTAQRYLQKVIEKVPHAVEPNVHLIIAAFYNQDYQTVAQAASSVEGKDFDDKELLDKVNNVNTEFKNYYPNDKFEAIVKKYSNNVNQVPDTALQSYVNKNVWDEYADFVNAERYFDKENYSKSDELLSASLTADGAYIPALEMKTSVKRELGQLDSSLYFCNKLLDINAESVFALSSKASTLLKKGKLKRGLELAQQTAQLDPSNAYNNATLAVAYHLIKQYKSRDGLLKVLEHNTADSTAANFVKDVISGKEKY